MGLPKIDLPIVTGKLLSNGDKVQYRPFTVKEEKILLLAQESQNVSEIFGAIEQVLNNCVIGQDVSSMTLFDVTYLMLQIRAISVGDIVEFSIKDKETEEVVNLELDIKQLKLHISEGHSNKISLGNDMTLFMRYPSFKEMKYINEGNEEELFNILISCMETLVHGDSVYKFSEFSEQEIIEFIDGMDSAGYQSLRDFFDTMPTIKAEFPYTNSNGNEQVFVIEGIDSFFM